ncbi:glycosyltransferase [Actinosynnema sp. NPDC020468]|uniref:glycosyltransferase n=1 Tax=Actinosynnema sp. NPDC020468 TaxID=3154488 RepID=UPI0034022B86
MVKVLHFVASVGDSYGGVSTAVAGLGAVERHLGHTPALVTVDRPEQGTDTLRAAVRSFDVHLLAPHPVGGRFHFGRELIPTARDLVARHDVVVVHGVFDAVAQAGWLAARAAGKPYLVWPHGSLDDYDLRKHRLAKFALAPLWRTMLAGASGVVCTTRREAERVRRFGASTRTAVVPLTTSLPPVIPRPRVTAEGRTVLFLGRVDHKKGLPLLLEAFDRAARPGDELVIAGGGDAELESLLRRRAGLIVGDRTVYFAGWADEAARRDLLASADVFALLSDNENFGLAVAEALESGLPVLLSDQVYLGDELAERGAAVVCERTPESAAAALRRLLDDPALRARCAERGKAYAREAFAVGAVAGAYRTALDGCRC